jgi:ATP-dependent Lhr-like helicase
LLVVETEIPSPFAASLQFGFVMDHLYGKEVPRAEARAALLSLDRALLDELMGAEGADEDTMRALAEVLAMRRGTAPKRRARTADELAVLVDRAGDVTEAELRERVATDEEGVVGDPIAALLADGRMLGVDIPVEGGRERRYLLTERWARLASAFGERAVTTVWTTEEIAREAEAAGGRPPRGEVASDPRPARHRLFAHPLDPSRLVPVQAANAIPESLRHATLARGAAARELLLRWLSLAGPVSLDDVRRRYRLPAEWVRARLDDWARAGTLVRGTFGDREVERWCARRVLEHARRRALAAARAAIEAVPLSAYVAFLQRWQQLDPRDRTEGAAGVERVTRQMYGLARPAAAWERDYLPARVERYDGEALSRLAARGELVWVGGGTWDESVGTWVLSTIRFVERGTEREWRRPGLRPETESRAARPGGSRDVSDAGDASPTPSPLSPDAARAYEALRAQGASFLADVERRSGLGPIAAREALRELVAAGLATNDTMDALREVVRLRPAARRDARDTPDPTRWLPADFTPSPGRPVVQRRPNPRRLAKWRRPDLPDRSGWVGRWSLVDYGDAASAFATDEPFAADEASAERVARQMLDRYGVVAREMWRRDRPALPWRAIYQELRRLEYRGEIRRGYFVRGLGGAQFALPEAVEAVREAARDDEAPVIVMATSDPADAYALDVPADARDPLARPRGRGALLVTRSGRVLLSVEGRGRRIAVAPGLAEGDVAAAARALAEHLVGRAVGRARARDLIVERIDDASAARSAGREAFRAAGYRSDGSALRVDAPAR